MKVTKVVITIAEAELISVPDGVEKEKSQKLLEKELERFRETFFIIGEKPVVESALELLMTKFESDEDIKIDVDFSDENNLLIFVDNKNHGVSRIKLGVEY